jgi:hypothetical protein
MTGRGRGAIRRAAESPSARTFPVDEKQSAPILAAVSSGALLAFALFASGLVSLLLWLAVMLGNPRLAPILRKAVVFFLLPGALMVVIPIIAPTLLLGVVLSGGLWALLGLLLLLVLFEEFLKLAASRSEARPDDKFAFAMLFGIGELMLSKPLGPLLAGEFFGGWSGWGLVGLIFGGMLAMMMHSVTAALYAYKFADRPWLGLLACFALHASYNFLVILFFGVVGGVVAAVIFAMFLIVLFGDRQTPDAIALEM